MQLALYKAKGTLVDRLIRLVTNSKYSHCELVINGFCCSSSIRDGGVRAKKIYLDQTKWDVLEIEGDDAAAWDWFALHAKEGYDWLGAFRFALPFLRHRKGKWFCSEACSAALRIPQPESFSPKTLADRFQK